MKRIVCAAVLLLSVGAAFAQPTDYDFVLTINDNTEDVIINAKTLFAFDWWYEPDLSLPVAGLQGVPQDVRVSAHPPRVFGDQYAYYPSDRWHTTLLEFPADLIPSNPAITSDVSFVMPLEHIADFAYLEGPLPPSTLLDNKFYIKDVRTFASYDAFLDDQDNIIDGDDHEAPVPEPASMMLLGTGILGMIGFKIRERFIR